MPSRTVRRRGAATIWIILGVAALVGAAIIGLMFWTRGGPPNATHAAYSGALQSPTPFPATVNGEVRVTYRVRTRNETRPSGAGAGFPPTTASPWVGASGLSVTFTLTNPNATFEDGTTAFTTTTDSAGDAVAVLVAAAAGDDTLGYSFTVGSQTITDSAPNTFTVDP